MDEEVGEAPASIFREPLHQEPPIKVVSGKHSMFTHFPKDRNCEVRKSTKGFLAENALEIKYLQQKTLVT